MLRFNVKFLADIALVNIEVHKYVISQRYRSGEKIKRLDARLTCEQC
jgi:hypothetical protein